jgi:MerR family copper efflux transcriptional regulator
MMTIKDAAERSGLSVKTVRYYANIGLVAPQKNETNGYREYENTDLAKLKFVGTARKFDFSIDQCRELLGLFEDEARSSREVKALTLSKIEEIDARLLELQSLRAELSALANACEGDDRPNCPILAGLSGTSGKPEA